MLIDQCGFKVFVLEQLAVTLDADRVLHGRLALPAPGRGSRLLLRFEKTRTNQAHQVGAVEVVTGTRAGPRAIQFQSTGRMGGGVRCGRLMEFQDYQCWNARLREFILPTALFVGDVRDCKMFILCRIMLGGAAVVKVCW